MAIELRRARAEDLEPYPDGSFDVVTATMDLPAELANAGFGEVDIAPFPTGSDPAGLPDRWRLPWTLVQAAALASGGAAHDAA